MIRDVISIDEDLCNGCGECVPGCPEGALQIIDGKARLVNDMFCDGLGACIGECPTGALKIEKKDAPPYDEAVVMENIIKGGANVIKAHLAHLDDHGETEFLNIAIAVLKEKGLPVPDYKSKEPKAGCPGSAPKEFNEPKPVHHHGGGCPGSASREMEAKTDDGSSEHKPSALTQWPIQLALQSPDMPYWQDADILIAADCAPFALNNFHGSILAGKKMVTYCPKLDPTYDEYMAKLTKLVAKARSVTIVRMEVPCCGIDGMVKQAIAQAGVSVPLETLVVRIDGSEVISV